MKPGYNQTVVGKVVSDFSRRDVVSRADLCATRSRQFAKRTRLFASAVGPAKVGDYFRKRMDEHLEKMGAVWK
jgi:hypothetical protein